MTNVKKALAILMLLINLALIINLGFIEGTIIVLIFTVVIFLNEGLLVYVRKNDSFVLSLITHILSTGILLILISFIVVELLINIESVKTQNIKPELLAGNKYMIILGAGLNGTDVSRRLEQRLEKALEYLQQSPNVKVVVSGGQGADELISEAEAMGRYLKSKGIKAERIIYEDKSTSTVENLTYSLEKIGEIDEHLDKVIIVTSDYHIYRATMIANELGIDSTGISSRSDFRVRINYMIREYLVVIKDWIYFRLELTSI